MVLINYFETKLIHGTMSEQHSKRRRTQFIITEKKEMISNKINDYQTCVKSKGSNSCRKMLSNLYNSIFDITTK